MNKLLQEPANLKQVAKRLETQLKDKGVASVGTGYALLNRLDPPDKARWALFVYAADPDSVKIDPEFEGYPVQVRGIPKPYSL
jgi:hypothetical protein